MASKNNMGIVIGALVAIVAIVVVLPQLGVNLGAAPGVPSTIVVTTEPVAPGEINPAIQGKSVSAAINVFDSESDTNAELTAQWLGVYKNGGIKVKDIDTYNSSVALTGVQVGDVISLFGRTNGSSPVYVDALEDFQLTGESPTISMTGATGLIESNLQIVCWDSNGDVFGDGGNATHAAMVDYNITLGSDATEQLTCRIKNNVADRAYDLGGICIGYTNDVDYLRIEGESEIFTNNPVGNNAWSPVIMPKHMSDATVTDGNLAVEYDVCYERADPIRLSEWDWVKIQFTMAADTTGCAALADGVAIVSNSTADLAWFLVKDKAWGEGADGRMYYGLADRGTNERDVGLAESVSSPAGQQSGVTWYCRG